MTRTAIVLRPAPGDIATARRLVALGLNIRRVPLFAVTPRSWNMPDVAGIDALLLTSANAVRHAGEGLAALRGLPVVAVGEATAAAVRAAGLDVVLTGERDAQVAIGAARQAGHARLLHLAGADHVDTGADVVTRIVYASDPLPVALGAIRRWSDAVVLLHSSRAATRFAALRTERREAIRLAALSPAVAAAAGEGWGAIACPPRPDDGLLCALARGLAD